MDYQMNSKRSDQLKKSGLIFITFTGMYLLPFLIQPVNYHENYFNLPLYKILFDMIGTLAICAAMVFLCLYIDQRLNRVMPWTKFALGRLFVQTVTQIFFTSLLILIFSVMMTVIFKFSKINFNELNISENDGWKYLLSMVFISLIISIINIVGYLAANWKSAIEIAAEYQISAAKNKQIAAETELHALRLQLDPHFVFNNLSVLSELILKDQQLGFEYTENFAKVYRYLLINSKKQLISLRDELRFLQSYLFLLKHRIGNGVIFEIQVDAKNLDLKLAPLTLQLLVENAIKHNRIAKENPLIIKISVNESAELTVENNILPLLKKPHSSQIGLENITARLALLSKGKPEIKKSETAFTVKIPLI
ncbi:sensor histidine kinase [Chryseobacterium salviniae]|uniref:Histidine kinase n=1 Tax=Chryseobacterium salviniae TaxID=3101750 RepID=A0ABU6HQK5_9FLAO|nr:histidine kinase [Chryseobacterium sp. T9W2-O]MEC3875329.1 histidine kinase [Chryseobacterium sp. T9W2-O]